MIASWLEAILYSNTHMEGEMTSSIIVGVVNALINSRFHNDIQTDTKRNLYVGVVVEFIVEKHCRKWWTGPAFLC